MMGFVSAGQRSRGFGTLMDVCRRFQIYCVDVGCAGLEFVG